MQRGNCKREEAADGECACRMCARRLQKSREKLDIFARVNESREYSIPSFVTQLNILAADGTHISVNIYAAPGVTKNESPLLRT